MSAVLVVMAMVGTKPHGLITAAPAALPTVRSDTVSFNHHGDIFTHVAPLVATHIFDKHGDRGNYDDLVRDWLHLKDCSDAGRGKEYIYHKRELESAEREEEEEELL